MMTGGNDLAGALAAWRNGAEPAVAARVLAAAEAASADARTAAGQAALWHEYLDATAYSAFLEALPDSGARERWARVAFQAILRSGYSLRLLLRQRAAAHGDRILFEDRREPDMPLWSYGEVARYARAVAGACLAVAAEPRVAIFCENNVDGAVADLACLSEGLLVTPLSVHLDEETLGWIFARLDINIAITDSDARQQVLERVCTRQGRRLTVFRTGSRAVAGESQHLETMPLRQACAQLDLGELDAVLARRTPDITAPATVMFTSGSTGRAKGVVFSQYMLLTKRFARAAALPAVGRNEVLLCYLPLFHTFGRFLEMLGMLYWRGTYVFAGNPSAEALMAELGRVRPTGLISVPVRWTQIREHSLEAMDRAGGEGEERAVRQVLGDRLRWGLSAAGYLDPRVFRFFQRHGVDLCSGFGMTEATGGITMTPPGAYEDGTVGMPLPGMETRLTAAGELEISGVYVASYLEEDAPAGTHPDVAPDPDHWIATGDLFRRHESGYFEIVDRIKDIYKNSRGQTIAPQRVETRFASVPGIRRTFLAGDHRDWNVLLIVPDRGEPLLQGRTEDEVIEYFAQIVASANAGLAPYERVVNFALLDRDFDPDRGELTPKGSYRRKTIEANFAPVIDRLYRGTTVERPLGEFSVRIPRWFFRDLGVLEADIRGTGTLLENRRTGALLRIERRGELVQVGDLAYHVEGDVIDLGVFARQPRLWLGNAALATFAPCRAGWDVPLGGVSERVRLVPRARRRTRPVQPAGPVRIDDERLREAHDLAVTALLAPVAAARTAIEGLGRLLAQAEIRTASVIRRRLEALAFHGDEDIRALAYRTLILDLPLIDYDRVFPAFIESGLTFLTSESITAIASARPGERRLQALRLRLYSYRTRMSWPGPPARRRQLRRVFQLLTDFARHNLDDYGSVQAELAAWALFREDPLLARSAHRHLDELTHWHEQRLRSTAGASGSGEDRPAGRVVFEFSIERSERARIERILFDPTFLRHSVSRAFGEEVFSWERVGWGGVWVSQLPSHRQVRLYRLGINLVDGHHFDLLLLVGATLRHRTVRDTMLWLTALSGHSLGTPVLPRFGAWRNDLGAATVAYVSDLTAWERIREIASRHDVPDAPPTHRALHRVYVRALATFFRVWEQSGYRIVPGAVSPHNVTLPEADFQEGTSILSLAGWRPSPDALAFVRPIRRNFYGLTAAHYPQLREHLKLAWIFEAAEEGLGEMAGRFMDALEQDLATAIGHGDAAAENEELLAALQRHRRAPAHERVPLPAACAIDRFVEWERINPAAAPQAREDAVLQMYDLYRLDRYPAGVRYHLYASTFFRRAPADVREAFARLAARARASADGLTGYLEELSELQSLLHDPVERAVFSRMVFPHARRTQKLELRALGGDDGARVIVRSEIRDTGGSVYDVRDTVTAAEVGQLYRLTLEAGYRARITEHDQQLIVTDAEERIVGGLAYRWEDAGVVAIEAVVVAGSLTNRGIGGRLLEDFVVRMAAQGAQVVRTNFFLGALFRKHGFDVSQRWGGLVRFTTARTWHPT
jgi:long-chain acyl-CoA synthetase